MSHCACIDNVIPLARPWHQRWLDTLAEGWHALRARRAQRDFEQWSVEDLATLSDHTLRDIGAPDWLRAEALARREADLRNAWNAGFGGRTDRVF